MTRRDLTKRMMTFVEGPGGRQGPATPYHGEDSIRGKAQHRQSQRRELGKEWAGRRNVQSEERMGDQLDSEAHLEGS